MASSYADCVTSLRQSLTFLDSSVETIGQGVSDYPRLIKVLKTVRVRIPLRINVKTRRPCEADTVPSTTNSSPNRPWLRLNRRCVTRSPRT